jgi:uncharacterized protein
MENENDSWTNRFPFLSARWSNLALVTYAVAPKVLARLVPPECELDLREGNAFVSLVAFDFLDTRVLGVPWPGFRNFPEINLRFYVRHLGQRGVCFVREYVPQRFVAGIARLIYNEPYVAAKMISRIEQTATSITTHHTLLLDGREQSLRLTGQLQTIRPEPDSVEHFFKEHEWGFGVTRSGRLIRYRIEHPIWDIHPVTSIELKWDWERVYGSTWSFLQDREPRSIVFAVGSAIKVFPKRPIQADGISDRFHEAGSI